MGSRVARLVAAASTIAAAVAVWPAVGVLLADPVGLDLRLFWVLIPILSAAGVLAAVRGPRWALVCALAGASCGFTVLTAWSVGLYFAPSALLLLAAAVAHLAAVRPTLRVLLVPFWLAAGATTPCILFVLRALAQSGDATVHPARLIVAGAWISVGLWAFLTLTTLPSWLHRRHQEPRAPAISLKP